MQNQTFRQLTAASIAALTIYAQAATCPANLGISTSPSTDFTVNTNGTVTQASTGLMWKQCLEGLSGSICATGTAASQGWSAALLAARNSSFAGYSDWRLPNKQELESLVDDTCYSPAINDAVFPNSNTVQAWTWSSTTQPESSASAWVVNFYAGATYTYDKTDTGNNVRIVRGGQAFDMLSTDTTPPDTTITSGPVTGSQTNAMVFFTGTDNVAVVGFECKLDAAPFGVCTSPISLTGLSLGSHTFQVRAKDAAGNLDPTPASVTWTVVDGIAPDTTITSGAPADSTATTATISFTGSDDVSPTVAFECRLDKSTYVACSSPQNLTNLSLGLHTFEVRAKDAAGNVDLTPASVTWRVTWTCPLLDIDGAGGPTAEVDAIIIMRYLLGVRGDALVSGLTPLGPRNTGILIEGYILNTVGTQFDVFGRPNAAPTATNDGLVLTRLMQGLGDAVLLSGIAVPSGSQFDTAPGIRSEVNRRCVAPRN